MVTSVNEPYLYRSGVGFGYDGVARIGFAGFYGTGSLLFDGRAILTAAHLFAGRTGSATIAFETRDGSQILSASKVLQHPGYDAQGNNDLAIIWLDEAAPLAANRYSLYRQSDEIGQVFTLSGYGQTGTGAMGATYAEAGRDRLKATNRFDADGATLKTILGSAIAWAPTANQLIADFDNGLARNDALGQLISRHDLGQNESEGFIAGGDSGGPAFINAALAGIANYTASLSAGAIKPDVDGTGNSSFGEIAAWQRVSAFQQWIDQTMRAHDAAAPTKPEQVQREVAEGNSGTKLAYFLLQFNGVRKDAHEVLSVDYTTRDGSAISGEDYLPVSGTLKLYPNEDQAVIPVEIIGDSIAESSEYFYLDVTNPVGGSFGEGVVKLMAIRTILDDDGFV